MTAREGKEVYRLIVADDEPWVAYRLSHLVDYEAMGFEVAGTAQDGDAALAMCRMYQADALLTDIRMPGMDGLELLHTLREEGMATEVILVSGYAEFAYAQAAVRDGAFDYLVKQVPAGQLQELLARLKRHLDQRSDARRERRKYEALLSLMHDDLSVEQWMARFFASVRAEAVCFGCFTQAPEDALAVLRTGRDTVAALLPCPDHALPTRMMNYSRRCGLSTVASPGTSAPLLFRQSSIAYRTACFVGTDRPTVYMAAPMEEAFRLLKELEEALASGGAACPALLGLLEQQARQMNLLQIAHLYNRLDLLLARSQGLDPDREEMDDQQLTIAFATLQEMFAFLADRLSGAAMEEHRFEPVLRYIDASFTQDLRISELAKQFHFSPSYFSTLFHKHTGETFTRYLTARRMARARALLQESSLSLQAVAEQCGYSDYFQFNKAFKKHTGFAPGQYRRQLAGTDGQP